MHGTKTKGLRVYLLPVGDSLGDRHASACHAFSFCHTTMLVPFLRAILWYSARLFPSFFRPSYRSLCFIVASVRLWLLTLPHYSDWSFFILAVPTRHPRERFPDLWRA